MDENVTVGRIKVGSVVRHRMPGSNRTRLLLVDRIDTVDGDLFLSGRLPYTSPVYAGSFRGHGGTFASHVTQIVTP